MMHEGFSTYEDFAGSVSDGFTNSVNEFVPQDSELVSNLDGYSALCDAMTGPLSTEKLRGITKAQIKTLQEYFCEGWGVELTQCEVVHCIRGALRQAVEDDSLDHF